jgi:uncharacterized membrane protein YdjX (TVP38/TMEM64 family)
MTPDAVPPEVKADRPGRRRWPVRPAAAIALIVILCVGVWISYSISLDMLVDRREALRGFVEARPWTAAFIYTAGYASAVALSLPGAAVLTVAGGLAFGWKLGAPLALMAGTVGSMVFLLLARGACGRLLARSAGPRAQRLAEGFRSDAFNYLLSLRLLPVVPYWLVNLAAALAAIPLRIFIVATLLGFVPVALALSVAGAGLDDAVSEQVLQRERCRQEGREPCRLDLGLFALLSPSTLIGLGMLGGLALLPVVARQLNDRRLRAKPDEKETAP